MIFFRILPLLEVVKNAGLTVEPVDDMPAKYDGHLDTHAEPRFIAVKRELHPADKTYVIAREVGRCAQYYQRDSPIINRPWKWRVLAEAPEEVRSRIRKLDAEFRGYCLMALCATREDLVGFIKRNPKKVLAILCADNVINFLLFKLRIQNWFASFYRCVVVR